MALFDPERKRIVVRVVYDGPGHAGKTTNLQRLCKSYASWRRSELVSPNTLGERTQYFDWLEVDGGLMAGYPVRAQLLTVPGQVELALRRQFVIERADVVVFVADSQPDAVAEAREFYAQLCEQLSSFPHPVPIVFQANKQDVPGALRPRELAKRVSAGLVAPTQVHGTVATSNRGVKQTLTLALRLSSDQLRARWSGDDPKSKVGEVGDAATTFAALEHHEAELARGRPVNLVPTLPSPELPAAQVWPPTSGARLIAAVYGHPLVTRTSADHPERRTYVVDVGAETGGAGTVRGIGAGAESWQLCTGSDRFYADLASATLALEQLGSRKIALGSWLPEPCAIALVPDPDGQGVWLWTLDPVLETLADALASGEPERRKDALLRFTEVALGAEALAERHHLGVELDPGSFAVQPGDRPRTRYVGHDLRALTAAETVELAAPLFELAAEFEDDELALVDFAEVFCMGLYQIPRTPERRAALREALLALPLETPDDASVGGAASNIQKVRDAACMVLRRPVRVSEE